MVAGLNLSVQIIRYFDVDDDIGGSVPSGTSIYQNIKARRIDHLVHIRRIPMLAEDQQGLESGRFNLFELYPASINVVENDEVIITNPSNYVDYQKHFRIISIMREGYSPTDPRAFLLVSCRRSVKAHATQ